MIRRLRRLLRRAQPRHRAPRHPRPHEHIWRPAQAYTLGRQRCVHWWCEATRIDPQALPPDGWLERSY